MNLGISMVMVYTRIVSFGTYVVPPTRLFKSTCSGTCFGRVFAMECRFKEMTTGFKHAWQVIHDN